MNRHALFALSSLGILATPALAGSHLWDVNEIFSNADGTVQFIELHVPCGGAGCASEEAIGNKSVRSMVGNGFATFSANVPDGTTAFAHLLIGTQAFADLPGAPAPDLIMVENFFLLDGDTIRWHLGPPTYDQVTFGAGMLPTDGIMSLNHDLSTGVNSPTNFAGETGSVDASVGDECVTFADCADQDENGIRDDNCVFWACEAGICIGTDITFADMGGQFGECPVDGTADNNDRNHALNCFADVQPDGNQGYDCEDNSPMALNVDAGGPFGDCNSDGVCDGNDAFHALGAFDGSSPCNCAASPEPPGATTPRILGVAGLRLATSNGAIRPGDTVAIDVLIDRPLSDLRGYQLHLGVSGGHRGALVLDDIAIEPRRNRAFAQEHPWTAFNVNTGQMVAGLDDAGIATTAGVYLATFTYRATRNASGSFAIELLHGQEPDQRTFLFPTQLGSTFAIETKPVIVRVGRR